MAAREWRLGLFVCLIAAVVLSLFAAGEGTLAGDVALQREIQQIAFPGDDVISGYGNWAGATATVTSIGLAMMVGLMMGGRYAAAALMFAVVIASYLNALLKISIDSPRPTPEQVQVVGTATGLGFPSAHVMGVVLLAGAAIYLTLVLIHYSWLRLPIIASAVVTVLATAFNRIWVGAHWPSGVLGGVLWGMTILLILIGSYRAFCDHLSRLGDWIDRTIPRLVHDDKE